MSDQGQPLREHHLSSVEAEHLHWKTDKLVCRLCNNTGLWASCWLAVPPLKREQQP